MPRPGCSFRTLITPLPREEAVLVRRKLALLWRILAAERRTYQSRTYRLVTAAPSRALKEFYFGPRMLIVLEPYDAHSPEAIDLAVSLLDQEQGPPWERQTFLLVSKDSRVREKVSGYTPQHGLRKIVVPMSYQELSISTSRSLFRRLEECVYAPRVGAL